MPAPDAFDRDLPIFAELDGDPDGRAWLARLPDLVRDLEGEWGLDSGSPYRSGVGAWTAPAITPDGTRAVLKVSWPHREAVGEPAGLSHWGGRGAVRLLRSDRARFALLIERCEPGNALGEAGLDPEDSLEAGAAVLRRLWSSPPTADLELEHVADVAAEWAGLLRDRHERLGRPCDAGLVDLAAELLDTLPGTAAREVVVHGDFNPGNVLAAQREPWLAIDPKPMIGDPAYDPWPMLVQVAPPFTRPDPETLLSQRFDLVADLVAEPTERLLAWAVARTVESSLWERSRGRAERADERMRRAAVLAHVAGL